MQRRRGDFTVSASALALEWDMEKPETTAVLLIPFCRSWKALTVFEPHSSSENESLSCWKEMAQERKETKLTRWQASWIDPTENLQRQPEKPCISYVSKSLINIYFMHNCSPS